MFFLHFSSSTAPQGTYSLLVRIEDQSQFPPPQGSARGHRYQIEDLVANRNMGEYCLLKAGSHLIFFFFFGVCGGESLNLERPFRPVVQSVQCSRNLYGDRERGWEWGGGEMASRETRVMTWLCR